MGAEVLGRVAVDRARNLVAQFFVERNRPVVEIKGISLPSLLDGSVRRSGERVRIVATLVDSATGEQLWAETYDRRLTDLDHRLHRERVFGAHPGIAQAADIALYGGTMLEGSISTLAAAHLFATVKHLEWGTEMFGPLLLTDDILVEALDYSDFTLKLPQGPGLGVTLDEDKVRHYTRK